MNDEAAKAKAQKKTNSLFVLACSRGYLDDVKGLLEKGANPQAVDKKGVSALHFGCGQGRLGVVQFLWSRGVELDSEDPAGNSPLQYAVTAGKTAVAEFLLGKGVWVEGCNGVDDSVLHIAARKGHVQIVTLLLQHGGKAVLRDVNKRGLTALGEAVVAGHTGIVDQLLQAGAKIGTASGWSLLHLAVALQSTEALTLLAGKADNVNVAATVDGSTSLHHAAASGSREAVECLVKAGADLSLADRDGKQAQDYVDPSNKDLKRLLATKAPPKTPAAALPGAAAIPMNDLDEFKAMDEAGRMTRVDRWAALEDPMQVEAAVSLFPLEVCTQVTELKKIRQVLNIQEAIVELLEDDDFQQMACNPKAIAIVEEVHRDRDAFRKYADNKMIMDLLRTLQRFHGVVRTNGGHDVPFQSLMRNVEDGYQGKSKLRLKGMKMMLDARRRAVIAAALAGNEKEAKKAAERELDPNRAPKPPPAPSKTTNAGPAATSRAAGGGADPDNLIGSLPPRQPWSWKRFRKEMWNALLQSVFMFTVAVIMLYFVTGRFPWVTPEDVPTSTEYEF